MDKKLFLQTIDITKKFGDVTAVDHVSLDIFKGEIRGLIGENGSGKSTISQMISGIYSITSGGIKVDGNEFKPKSPLDATEKKIAMIVQETGTIDYLSITENLFLGSEKKFTKFGYLNTKQMENEAKKILESVGLENLDVNIPIISYSFEIRKMVEIAKALAIDPELFIVDETTTALSQDGRIKIHEIMRELKNKNKAVLFISHDLDELMKTCDSLTVLRDGKLIATINKEDYNEDLIKRTMVGREITGNYYRSDYDYNHQDKVMLKAESVSSDMLDDVSLTLHAGEIIGIGGLSQSGMHEFAKALFGMGKKKSGKITSFSERALSTKERFNRNLAKLKKKNLTIESEAVEIEINSIKDALKAHIGYISKDRDKETLILPASIKENLALSNQDDLSIFGIITNKAEKEFSKEMIEKFNIKCSSMNQLVKELSGGNKQKVSFAKWIGNDSKILIFDSPTRGVDIGVKSTMYQLLYKLKLDGYGIIIISEELPELIGMSDRIEIFKNGKIQKEFLRDKNLCEADIISYMI